VQRATSGGATRQAWIHQEIAVEILRKVTALCDPARLPFLVVKGAVTSRLLYDDIAERPISDVDIRIRRRDFWRWREIAEEWKPVCWNVVWTYRNRAYDFSPLSLDVEADIGPPGLCSLTVDAALSRATRLDIAVGLNVLVPEIHDHALILVVNAFKDRFVVGNPWSIADLERIVRHPAFRHELFVELVRESHVTTMAWIVAAWLETHYASEQWGAIRSAIERTAAPRRLYATLYRRVAMSSGGASLPAYFFAMLGADSFPAQVRTFANTLAWVGERRLRGVTHTRSLG
jgi:Uncharacterised nucleotidyltransferase